MATGNVGKIDELFDQFRQVLLSGFTPDYMEMALKQLREFSASPKTREDVLEFLKKTENVPEQAIVALTSNSIALLTNDEGTLLEFA